MGTRKCQNLTSQLDTHQKTVLLFSSSIFTLQELVDMTNEVEKKGEIYFKVRLSINSHPNWLPRLFDSVVVCWHWQLDRWWKISDLINDLAGLLYAGLEEVQGGGRGGVHQSYVQGGHWVKGSQLCWSNHFQCMCGTDPHPVGFRAKKYKVRCRAWKVSNFIIP